MIKIKYVSEKLFTVLKIKTLHIYIQIILNS